MYMGSALPFRPALKSLHLQSCAPCKNIAFTYYVYFLEQITHI